MIVVVIGVVVVIVVVVIVVGYVHVKKHARFTTQYTYHSTTQSLS